MTAQLILLGGPAGSGKTTTADAWATAQPLPAAHLNLDSVRGRFRSHLQQPHIAGWTPEVDWQYDLARRVVLAAAREYLNSGVTCIVDDGLLPTHPAISYERWSEQLQGLSHQVVILLLDVAPAELAGDQPARSRHGTADAVIMHKGLVRTACRGPFLHDHRGRCG